MHPVWQASRIALENIMKARNQKTGKALTTPNMRQRVCRIALAMLAVIACVTAGCTKQSRAPSDSMALPEPAPKAPASDYLAMALAPHAGDGSIDQEIRRLQEQVRHGHDRNGALERLGWAFVAKARESFESAYYRHAEACALALELNAPHSAEALLLRGHVLQNRHQFKEAEAIARELVVQRGLSFDYALLGDALLDQGRLREAASAYQPMLDLRPDLHSYSRASHLRWLTGDLDGAIELAHLAVSSSSPADPEAAAWVQTRLAGLQLQNPDLEAATASCETALSTRPDYPPALMLRGRMLLATQDADEAIEVLEKAAQLNPLPEYDWVLAEALRAAGRDSDAQRIEARLRTQGAALDPKTLSLYLATRGEEIDYAVRLAEEEVNEHATVFTQDALAWALAAAGRIDEARRRMTLALAEGTQDARLFFHASVIAARAERFDEALDWLPKAARLIDSLLPTEQELLGKLAESLAQQQRTESRTIEDSPSGS